MQLPKLTEEPLQHVDLYPDSNYPIRILEAHMHNANCKWVLSADISDGERRVYEEMNATCDIRVAFLRRAITILEANKELLERD